LRPDFVVDISDLIELKMKSVMAFRTQFYDPDSNEPETPISGKAFLEFLYARAIDFGRPAGFQYAEGFQVERYPGVDTLFDLR
ncbi:MAG: bacillithiol biosynthesis deacetylase BshB1, partial [Bacteroidota bacterium]